MYSILFIFDLNKIKNCVFLNLFCMDYLIHDEIFHDCISVIVFFLRFIQFLTGFPVGKIVLLNGENRGRAAGCQKGTPFVQKTPIVFKMGSNLFYRSIDQF